MKITRKDLRTGAVSEVGTWEGITLSTGHAFLLQYALKEARAREDIESHFHRVEKGELRKKVVGLMDRQKVVVVEFTLE